MKTKVTKVLPLVLGAVLCVVVAEPAWVVETARADDTKRESAVVKKYPPYPDVWDWVIPVPQRATRYLQADLQTDGDVRISYKLKSKKLKKQEEDYPEGGSFATTFFGRRAVTPREKIKPYTLDRAWRVTLQSGKVLESPGPHLMMESKGCFERLDRTFYFKDSEGTQLGRTYLYYALSKPRRFTVSENCYDGTDFTYQVETVWGDLVSLKDGTFLIIDGEHGLVLRFDEKFKTKSSLLNNKVFVVDSTSPPFGDPQGYGSREEGNRDWQRYEDDLYHHLMDVKGGK